MSRALALAAALAAWWAPAQTLTLAFTVLGPLHYLTELAWLRRRGLFAAPGGAPWLGAAAAVGIASAGALELGAGSAALQEAAIAAMAVAAAIAAPLGLGRPSGAAIAAVAGATAIAVHLALASAWAWPVLLLFGVLLPTVLHVGAFTLMFLAHGWRRRGSAADRDTIVIALVALALLSQARAPVAPDPAYAEIAGFLHHHLGPLLGVTGDPDALSGGHAALARALAFLYAHHFLNWFGKTGRVGLDRLPRSDAAVIAVGALACTAAYAWDVRLGLMVALAPNVAHVIAELPLDWRAAAELAGVAGRGR